jgi:hypothetical protein
LFIKEDSNNAEIESSESKQIKNIKNRDNRRKTDGAALVLTVSV